MLPAILCTRRATPLETQAHDRRKIVHLKHLVHRSLDYCRQTGFVGSCKPIALPPSILLMDNCQLMPVVTCCACRHSRATGKGILPLKQGVLDTQAEVLSTHSSLFEYEGRGFLVSGNALTQYSFRDIMRLRGNIHFPTMHRVKSSAAHSALIINTYKHCSLPFLPACTSLNVI